MKYSAGMVSSLFWLSETRKTAKLLMVGNDVQAIRVLAQTENIYQVKNETRARKIANVIVKRLKSLPDDYLKFIVTGDIGTAKLIILISIMKTDLLFFEFIHQVYRLAIRLGEMAITDRSINNFFDEKKRQSETVAVWTETTTQKLKQQYIKNLLEAGVIQIVTGQRKIIIPLVDYNLRKQLEDHGFTPYLNAITGEA
ncbi:DUF1819 family protein [Acetobacterium sp. KB-1]|jgi:hypothetical protein|uniref:DUF1819 family protein n=1 Tax=Acetobacterium sp. KB-1 TaxID=2184575 RepID=UPI000DBEC46D|nr:DUF1819 family protein [Acetobacterium sp. KB-1]AWW26793.1 DUF1819 domain-containing protein [Acetobacterium sp. KB-1]